MFIIYPKILRLGHEDTDGILEGKCHIQEKIDGANTSVWIEDGIIKCASRNHPVESGFNGFVDYIENHEGVNRLLKEHPDYRLYGEWLVKHTVQYNETAYKKWYMFDIHVGDAWYDTAVVNAHAITYGIDKPTLFATIDNPTMEDLNGFMGRSDLGQIGEGIVIKNPLFINKFFNRQYAKLVSEKFKEDNAITFGGNNKHSECYFEMWVVNKFMTLERIRKIMNKIQPTIDEKLDMEHTSKIINTAFHDMLTEEIWTIQKKCQSIDFRKLGHLAQKKAAKIYHDILNDFISVAYSNDKL